MLAHKKGIIRVFKEDPEEAIRSLRESFAERHIDEFLTDFKTNLFCFVVANGGLNKIANGETIDRSKFRRAINTMYENYQDVVDVCKALGLDLDY